MTDSSETFRPVRQEYEDCSDFTQPELCYVTASSRLYRVRKAGKFFMLKTAKINSGMWLDLLIREYELSIGFSHPGIINVYTYEPQTLVGPAIVMEYIDGRNLADFLAEHPSPTVCDRIFEQLLDAVNCLHKADIIHNDLKPQNILITRANDDVKLIDFGLSDNSAHYLLKQLGATPKYASPELLGHKSTDARSDIYSIGKIMYDLFGNHHGSIQKRCLQDNPERRYSNIDELQQAWRRKKLPQHIAIGLFLAAALVIPSVLYINEHLHRTDLEQTAAEQQQYYDSVTLVLRQQINATNAIVERQRQIVDSLACYYDKKVRSAYEQVKTQLASIPFREFAFYPVTQFYQYTWKLGDKLTQDITDHSIHSQLTSHFDALRNELQRKLYDTVDIKPLMDSKKMTAEEYTFYLNLLEEKNEFRKYQR